MPLHDGVNVDKVDAAPTDTVATDPRVVIGTWITSFLGTLFGMALIVIGSFMNWRSDNVLGLFNRSGLRYHNIVSGDGKITIVLGSIGFLALLLGAVFRWKPFYGAAFVCTLAAFILSIYEIAFLWTSPGIVTPGTGIFMICGGCVAGSLCSLAGFFMVGGKR